MLLALSRDLAYLRGGGFDMLKVAHRGSRLQDPALVAELRAPVAVISVGVDNTYGHPAQKAMDLLRASGSPVFRTDQRGDIAVSRGSGEHPCLHPGR